MHLATSLLFIAVYLSSIFEILPFIVPLGLGGHQDAGNFLGSVGDGIGHGVGAGAAAWLFDVACSCC